MPERAKRSSLRLEPKEQLTTKRLVEHAANALAWLLCSVAALKIAGLYEPLLAFVMAHRWPLLKCLVAYVLLGPLIKFPVTFVTPIVTWWLEEGRHGKRATNGQIPAPSQPGQ